MGQPPRLLPAGLFIACLYLLTPVSANQCIVGCHGMQTSKGYEEGHTYIYEYEGTSVTSVSEAQGESNVKVNAIVELAVKPDCVHQLKLKTVRVNGAPVSLQDVEKYALQFNYHDGHIDTSICAESGDSQSSLNIKRAITSLFQSGVIQENGVTTHRETDIFGSCQTDYEFRREGDALTIRKYRNLATCSHRENIKHGLIYAAFNEASGIKSSPIVDSQQKIEQIFKKGILNSAKSIETYNYRLFSHGNDAGAKTIVQTTLTFKADKPESNGNAIVTLPKSIIFDAPHPVTDSSVEKIENSLKTVKSSSGPESVNDKAAELFGEFIKVLRRSNKKDILNVYEKIKSGTGGFDKNTDKKILLDGLYRTGSGDSAEVIAELIKNNELTKLQILGYYASLALVEHVNLSTITAVTSLLDQQDIPRIGYLGIGRVIGKYTEQHNSDNVPEIKAALEKITAKIGNGKPGNRKQENQIIAATKGLKNAKYLDDKTIDNLINIVKDKTVHNRVRVAAIEAFPAKCSMKWKKPLLEVFSDLEEDSEIRIKSYLSLVACPCNHVANEIKKILDKEKINQVGSFVTTHLRNLRASVDPNKEIAKKYFGEIRSINKFPEDFRKFSFNRECSYDISALGIGSSTEQNVIYSQKSWIPRSTSLNLTTELFGRSFNFLEIDTRIENLDKIIEHYLGPKGIFKTNEIKSLVSDSKKSINDVYQHIQERYGATFGRGKRSISQSELDNFAKTTKSIDSEVDEDLDIDLSVKLFGVELVFLDFKESGKESDPNFKIDRIFDFIEQVLNKAKNFDYTHTKHAHLLDINLIYPTGLGFPLSVGAEANAVTHLRSSGKIDLPAILKDPKNSIIKIGVEPSANIMIAVNVMIDSLGNENGLKIIGRIHTSTGSDLSIKILEGNGIDINFGIPKKKQEIISISSEVIFIDSSGKKISPKFGNGKEYSDCFDQFSSILGLTVCGDFAYPYENIESITKKPYIFPLSAPSKFAISIENTDATSYHFRTFYDKSKDTSRSFEILFETPNSRNNRKIALKIDATNEPTQKIIKANFDSPMKKADVELHFENTDQKKALSLKLKHDTDEYYGIIGIIANGNKYKPILEYKVPEHIERLTGKTPKTKSAYSVEGDIAVNDENSGKKYIFENVAILAANKKLISVDGWVFVSPVQLSTDTKLSHNDENIQIKLDAKRTGTGIDIKFGIVPSKDKQLAFKLALLHNREDESIENKFIFVHGADLDSKINRFTFIEKIYYKKNEHPANKYAILSAIKYESKLTWPAQELDAKFENDISSSKFKTDFDFKYAKFKIGMEFDVKSDESNRNNFEIDFDAYAFENKISASAKQQMITPYKRKIVGKLELPGTKYQGESIINYQVEGPNANIQFDGDFKINDKTIKLNYGLDATIEKINSNALIDIIGNKYLEFTLKIKRGQNPNGNINLNIKELLIINGDFKYQTGKGNAIINIDMPKIQRKIKGSGDISISGTKHVAIIEILLDAERDPNKIIKLSTDSDLTKGSIDSKNIIEILSYKFETNVKGSIKPKPNRGYDFDGDIDVTLPNNLYFVAKGKQSVDRKTDKTDIHGQYEFNCYEKKGSPGRKFEYNYDVIIQEPKGHEFSGKQIYKFVNVDGKDIDLSIISKYVSSVENPEKRRTELQVLASGKYLPKKFNFDFTTDYTTKKTGSWNLDSKLGDDFSVIGNGNMVDGISPKDPKTSDAKLEIKLPFDKLKNIKYEGKASLVAPEGDTELKVTNGLSWNDNKNVKAEIEFKKSGFNEKGVKDIAGKLILNILDNPQVSVATSMKYDGTQDLKKGNTKVVINYGEKEVSIETDAAYNIDLSNVDFDIKATTPIEKFKKIDFGIDFKHENEGLIKSDIHFIADDQKYAMTSEFDCKPNAHRAEIVFTCPTGKTQLLSKFTKLNDNEYKGEYKIDTPKGFVAADGHVKIESVDNFIIEVNFDSDKSIHRKIYVKIATEPTVKNGNKIALVVTSDGKNIVTGSTNYSKRDESGKIIVEGNGSLKIGDNTRVSKFTYSRQQLTKENDGETGVAILLNANFGPSAVVGELKLTNKEVHVFNSYCEQSKDCAHFKLQSTLNKDKETRVDHQITVEVDLKKFKLPVEFGLKTTTKYNPKEHNFDHTANLYLHTSKDKTQYSTQIYVHPKESAIILTLPSRELALIASVDIPKNKSPIGAYKIDLSAYLDRKNHPKDKTSFVASGDFQIEKNTASISGEATFSYPQAPKDMIVKGKLHYGGEHLLDAAIDIDVFAKKTQKISMAARLIKSPIPKGYNVTGSLEVNSRGQQLKVELKEHYAISGNEIGFGSFITYNDLNQKPKTAGILFSLNLNEGHLLIQAPNKNLIKIDSTFEYSKALQKMETETSLLENPPVIISSELKDLNSFKYQSYEKDKPNTKLQIISRIIIGQLAEFHADHFKEGDKKSLISFALYLDESRFLKPDFSCNKENIGNLFNFYKEKIYKRAEQIRDEIKLLNNEANVEFDDLFAHLKKASPDLKPMINYYQGELDKLKQELDADRTIQQIQATINKVFGGLIAAITDTIKQLSEKIGDLQIQFHQIQEKLLESVKITYPKIKESIDKILKVTIEILDAATKLGSTYLKALLNVFNKHQKELKELATAISELIHDIIKIVMKGANQVEGEFNNFITLLSQQIKALPIYDILKSKWSEIISYQIPEAVLGPIEEAFVQIKMILPTEELREFFTITYNYIIKHVKHQNVDDLAEIKNIWTHGIDALQSIIALVQSKTTSEQLHGIIETKFGYNIGIIKQFSSIPILRLSIINLIRNKELPTISELYHTYRPTAYFSDIVPPFSHTGIVTEGGHFFTFDGKHITLAGSCDYVLSQDTKDGNFSIIGTFNNGQLNAITITAPGESITLKSDGNILVDNKPAEYPANTKNLHAFMILPIVNVKSDYGVHIACNQKTPMICSVRVSGFYHGKLKGIFGNADNEPYDDFTIPNGHVTENESEFGNAYRLNSKCEAAKEVDHHSHGHRDPICTEYFSSTSSLSPCFNYVNPSNYRTACDHAVHAGTKNAQCLISAAYYAACRVERKPISIPSSCGNCKIGKDIISIDDSVSVKIPRKEADVIFVVEQEAKNEKIFKELITPLINEVKNELKEQGITDVHIGLIGFGEHMKWPQHYTTNGDININGEVKNINFVEGEPLITFKEAKQGNPETRFNYAKQRLNVELGTFKLTDAYEEAIHYPFRTGAAKVVVGVLASPCEKSPLPLSLQHLRLFMGQKIYRDLGLTYHHIGFLNEILIGGKPQKNVVGYDANSAYAFTDSKKKPLEGSLERESLAISTNDVCASFATSSGGAAYSSDNFIEAKPNQKKQFIQVTARRLAEGLTNIEIDEDCTCKQVNGLTGYARCKIVARKEKESLAKHTKG